MFRFLVVNDLLNLTVVHVFPQLQKLLPLHIHTQQGGREGGGSQSIASWHRERAHVVSVGVLLAQLPLVLDNGLQVREAVSNLGEWN